MAETNRLQWMDVARGLAMFIVVYSHIQLFCVPGYPGSPLIDFMRMYYLAGFFFIAGYFVPQRLAIGDLNDVKAYIIKKCRQLLLPTIVCMTIYAYTHGATFSSAIRSDAKLGYWFTFVLFEMSVILGVVIWLSARVQKQWAVSFSALIVTTVSFVLFRCIGWNGSIEKLFCIGGLANYFPFYIAGFLLKRETNLLYNLRSYWSGIVVIMMALIVGYYFGVTPLFITCMCVVLVTIAGAKCLCGRYLSGGALRLMIPC
jgi:fucose 4-O-acetylase-like acetyltransferase